MAQALKSTPSAFSEGMNSYLFDAPRENCPYPAGSDEREMWLEGWDQTAHHERRLYSMPLLSARGWFGTEESPA